MLAAELARKIENLPNDEYHMVEVYVDNVVEYSRRRRKEEAWEKIKADLSSSEKRMRLEGGIGSAELRKQLGA